MNILCGTDFSDSSKRAVTAAAHLAKLNAARLELVHVLDIPGAEEILEAGADARVTEFYASERARRLELLRSEARRAKPIAGDVQVEVLTGRADQAIVTRAAESKADLVVIAAVGNRGDSMWRLGSTADRIAQASASPVLVVRDEGPLRAWSSKERPLRIVVGIDLTATADAALSWAVRLVERGQCTILCVHVFWPPEMRERLHRDGLVLGAGDRAVQQALEGDLKSRIARIAGRVPVELRLVGGLGRPADHLAQVVAEEKSDLLVIGTHRRTGAGRLWHGSVSHDAIVRAGVNVAIVSPT